MTSFVLTATQNVTRENVTGGVFDTLLGTYAWDLSHPRSQADGEIPTVDLTAQPIVGWKVRLAGFGNGGDGTCAWQISFTDPTPGPSYFAIGDYFPSTSETIVFPAGDPFNQTEFVEIITIDDCFFGTPDNPSSYMYSLENGIASLAAPVDGSGFGKVLVEIDIPFGSPPFTLTAFELILYTRTMLPPKRVYPRPIRRAYPLPNTRQTGRRTGSGSIL